MHHVHLHLQIQNIKILFLTFLLSKFTNAIFLRIRKFLQNIVRDMNKNRENKKFQFQKGLTN